ncbi:homocysteine S-methyltransferase [Frondihabitans sucicola]|uniref:Homocysteine S-methyltransferase n=1 Tax=Frondihabitans sucicola TaxID=1268041 RepID=A0ABM8GR96_9MICO|nr:homocysteine S-methyltransferase [Frondihabitans sucicola]BDZ50987.1 homocysteine S-methyltransferase [Frondihabitans sucicola]
MFRSIGPVAIDGGLGTLLESRGLDLTGGLWSARVLDEHPEQVSAAHESFFHAGASLAISGSYQVSYEGVAKAGLDAADADRLLRRSVQLAVHARDVARPDGLVAASVGPYGAMLADGSEYRGDYGLTVAELRAWHRPRLEVLADSGADLLAFETIPCLAEAEALVAAVDGTGIPAWLSITASFGRLRSGEPLEEAFALTRGVDEIVAVGINCSHPGEVEAAIAAAVATTDLPIVVYPNGGEEWDAKNHTWIGEPGFPADLVTSWVEAGASLVGGCCRVGPAQIREIARQLAAV